MNFDLQSILPALILKAIAWGETQATKIAQKGLGLGNSLVPVARNAGVQYPERIRIAEVRRLPLPKDPELKRVALATGLLGPNMIGLTLGYGIYVCHGYMSISLLSHEFRHVYQHKTAGSIAEYLPVYLQQIATFGYHNALYEIDARKFD
jgi:hypothetical protein